MPRARTCGHLAACASPSGARLSAGLCSLATHPVARPPCGPAAPRKQSPGGNGRHQDGRAGAKGALRLSRRTQSAAAVPSAPVRRTLTQASRPRSGTRRPPPTTTTTSTTTAAATPLPTGEPSRAPDRRTRGHGGCGPGRPCHAIADPGPGSLGHPPREALSLTRAMRTNERPWLSRSRHRAGRPGAGE